MPSDTRETRDEVVQLGPFVEGMDNLLPEYALPPNRLRNAVNVDLPDTGNPARRKGTTRVLPANGAHSFWALDETTAFFVDNGDLKMVQPASDGGYVTTTLRSGLGWRPLSFADHNGHVYYSNGFVTGRIIGPANFGWGIAAPVRIPTLSAAVGGLKAGLYQATITYSNALGEESGSPLPAQINIQEGGSFALLDIPTPVNPDVNRIRIYASPPNGDQLYLQAVVSPGTLSYQVWNVRTDGPHLTTALLREPPPGDIVRAGFGRLWIAAGAFLHYTEAFSPIHYNASKGFIPFPSDISIVEPVAGGIHIVADKHYFLPAGNPQGQLIAGLKYGAVPGTGVTLDNGKRAAWMSQRGFVVGNPDGSVENLQESRVALDPMARGASMYREQNGMHQLVGACSPQGEANTLVATSFITAEVVRRKDLS